MSNIGSLVPQNFILFKGKDDSLVIPVCDNDGNVVDITGKTVQWDVAEREIGGTIVLEKSNISAGGISLSNPTQGEFTVTIDNIDTLDWTEKWYAYDGKITEPSGEHTFIIFGMIELRSTIT